MATIGVLACAIFAPEAFIVVVSDPPVATVAKIVFAVAIHVAAHHLWSGKNDSS